MSGSMWLLAVGSGLHIGQDDLPLDTARRLLGEEAVIGVSCTTPDEARIAVQGGADYLGIGPCYDTPSKIYLKTTIGPRGCARVLDAVNDSPIPTVVIGGVQLHNVERILHGCVSAGGKPITGVAVVSAIVSAENPRKAAEQLKAAVRRHHSRVSSCIKRLWEAGEAEGMLAMIWRTTVQEGGVIQNVTNTVVQNDCANVCLALKCSPIMSSEASEAADLSKILGALVVNLGTLNGKQIEGMIATAICANQNGKPLVLDPVGIGASELRQTTAARLMNAAQFTVIKGNASEIGYLAGADGATSRGVDSSGKLSDPAAVVKHLALRERCVVALTGEEDYVSDGVTVIKISNGHSYLGLITGSGCMTGSAIGCLLSGARAMCSGARNLPTDVVLAAAVAGIAAIGIAGEIAAARDDVQGPGTFRAALLDELWRLQRDTFLSRLRIEVVVAPTQKDLASSYKRASASSAG